MKQHDDLDLLAEDLRLAVGYLVRTTRARADQLSRGRAESLAQLDADGPQTIAQLAARRGVRHQAMSRTVSELEHLGLVEREASRSDGRSYVIRISDLGRAELRRDRAARRDLLSSSIAERLTDEERATLRLVPELLRKIAPSDARTR